MPQGRYDPFMGSLPPVNEDPRKMVQGQQPQDPLGALIQQNLQSGLSAAQPPQRRLNQWEILAGLSNPQLMEYVLGLKNQTPQMQQYQAQQKMVPHLLDAYTAQQRMGQGQNREARLEEQFRWRQLLQSQNKFHISDLYNENTGLMEKWRIYTNPAGLEVGRVPEGFARVSWTPYTGPGGGVEGFPNVNVPPQGAVPGAGASIPTGGFGAPTAQPTGTPNTGANVSGVIPAGEGTSPSPQNPSNKKRLRQASNTAIDQSTRQQKFLGGLEGAYAAVDAAHTAQVSRFGSSPLGMLGQIAQDKLAQGRYGRAAVAQYGDREVSDYYNKIRLSVYDYVKAQTGAQFSITEMDRYLASFPTTVDDPQTAKNLIWEHARRAVREINTLKMNWQAIQVGNQRVYVSPDYLDEFLTTGGAQPPPEGQYAGRILKQSIFQQLSLGDRQRFMEGGGRVEP